MYKRLIALSFVKEWRKKKGKAEKKKEAKGKKRKMASGRLSRQVENGELEALFSSGSRVKYSNGPLCIQTAHFSRLE